jgi:hypothetical protein
LLLVQLIVSRPAAQGPKRPGERIYKGHKSYDLMLNLQLGIRYSVGGVQARPSAPMLLPTDFQDTVRSPAKSGHNDYDLADKKLSVKL